VQTSENDEREPLSTQIGKILRELRRRRGWSQTDLGRLVGLSMATISNLETGRTQISVDHLQTFADAFGTSPAALLSTETAGQNEHEAQVMAAIRQGDAPAALDALASALDTTVDELASSHRENPSQTDRELEQLGRNAARLARSVSRAISARDGSDAMVVLKGWLDDSGGSE